MPALPEIETYVSEVKDAFVDFKTEVTSLLGDIDLSTAATVALVIVGLILLFDLIVYFLAAASTTTTGGRSLMLSPLVAKMAHHAWDMRDELGLSNLIDGRSLDNASQILNGIELAIKKYGKYE